MFDTGGLAKNLPRSCPEVIDLAGGICGICGISFAPFKKKNILYGTLENKYLKYRKCRRGHSNTFDNPGLSITNFGSRLEEAAINDAALSKTNVLPNCLVVDLVTIFNRQPIYCGFEIFLLGT